MANLTVVAGPNGSGKSTLIHYLQSRGVDFGIYINADDIAKEQRLSGEEGSKIAQRLADTMRIDCLLDRKDFTFETVMSHESKPQFMELARSQAIHVTLYFVCTDDPQTNVSRVKYRRIHGGHDVPIDRIIARYHRSLALLPRAISASDRVILFDNSADRMHRVEATLRPVANLTRNSSDKMSVDFQDRLPDWAEPVLEQFR